MFKNLVFLKDESQLKKTKKPTKDNVSRRKQRLVGFDSAALNAVAESQRKHVYHPPTPRKPWGSGADGWSDSDSETFVISPNWERPVSSEMRSSGQVRMASQSRGSLGQSQPEEDEDNQSESSRALVGYQVSLNNSAFNQSEQSHQRSPSPSENAMSSPNSEVLQNAQVGRDVSPTMDNISENGSKRRTSHEGLTGQASSGSSRPSSVGTGTQPSRTGSMLVGAAEKGDVSAVKKLLTRPVDPDTKTKYQSRSALHLAAGYGQTIVVEQLLQAGADAGQVSQAGRTPLHEACQGGHTDVVSLLLDYTPDVDVQDKDGQTPTHLAAFNGEVECLQILVGKDSSLVLEDRQGRQAAHLAAIRNHAAVLKFLCKAGVDLECVCDQGKLPVHYAAQHGALESLLCLVEHDCDITIGDPTGNLPLHYAASHNHVDCVRFLLKQGTAIDAQNNDGKTPAHLAALHKAVQTLHWLLEKGAAVNATDGAFNTPAHCAAEGGRGQCFHCVLSHGADLHAHNARSESPLNTARRFGHPLLMDKAVKGEVKCPLCDQTKKYSDWQTSKRPSSVIQSVGNLRSMAYTSPLPKLVAKPETRSLFHQFGQRKSTFNPAPKEKKSAKKTLSRRDPATQFFGQHISDEIYKLNL